MKRFSAIVAGGILVAGLVAQAADPVYSVNAVGYTKMSIPEGASLISLPFNKVGGSALSFDETFGTSVPDQALLFFYVPGSGYVSYQYFVPDGWYDKDFNLAGTNKIMRGEGFWFISPVATNIVFAGEVPGQADATNDIPIINGIQLISFAYPTTGSLTNGVFTPEDQDIIFSYVAGSGYVSYQYFAPDGWYDKDFNIVDVNVAVGAGFWYLSQDPNAKVWKQAKPYDWP